MANVSQRTHADRKQSQALLSIITKKYTINEAAEILGVSRSTIYNYSIQYETKTLAESSLKKILQALEINVDDLLLSEKNTFPEGKTARLLFELFKDLQSDAESLSGLKLMCLKFEHYEMAAIIKELEINTSKAATQ